MAGGSGSSLPELGSPSYFPALYAHLSESAGGTIDKHVLTCILFCLMGRAHLPSGNHLLLRTQREEISRLRELVLSLLSNIFGLTTLHLKCRSDTTPESLISDLLGRSPSQLDGSSEPANHMRKGSSGLSRTSSSAGRRPQVSVPRSTANNGRSPSVGTSVGPLPQAVVVSSIGRSSHDSQETLWDICRTRSCTYNGTVHHFSQDLLVILLNDIGDGREQPHIISCLLDQFSFSSYVDIASTVVQPQASPTSAVITAQYLQRLKHYQLPSVDPFLSNYLSNLLTATTQHPLLHALLIGNRARSAFKHFAAVSAVLFCNNDGRTQTQHVTQEDIARVYVHVIGHRVSIRNVGEGVLSVLDRTVAPLPHDESKEWKPGMKRGETVPQIMRDVLGIV